MQGFNMGRYVPPDVEGVLSANQVSNKHALGSRARNFHKTGALTVRFEMPFAIWCSHCPKPTIIGQGVRFNAEKQKVGAYYSTPIFSFRMKHTACGGWIEIRTDPKNTEYVVADGAKRRDVGQGKVRMGEEDGEIGIALSTEERERLANDAFAALEVKVGDRKQATSDKGRVEELFYHQERDWDDTYSANSRLRKAFRTERKTREADEAKGETLREKLSLGLDMLPETAEDELRAKSIEYGALSEDADGFKMVLAALSYTDGIGGSSAHSNANYDGRSSETRRKAPDLTASKVRRRLLQQELRQNTRMAVDPFILNPLPTEKKTTTTDATLLPGIKRKRPLAPPVQDDADGKEPPISKVALVDYDSD